MFLLLKLILLHFPNQEMWFVKNWLQYFFVENMKCLGHQDNVICLLIKYIFAEPASVWGIYGSLQGFLKEAIV